MTLHASPPPELVRVRDMVGALRRRWATSRLELVEWLPHQADVLRDVAMFRLLRTGNQLGKTEVGIAEVLYAALGWHPYREPTLDHGEYWVLCASWSQSVAIQAKLWALAPRARLRPGTTFSESNGFGGRHPHVAIRHEDGAYSIVRFKTTGQESIDVSGATIDGALFDEPPKDVTLFSEVQKRVQANAGWLLLTLTPIGADVSWLRALVDAGVVSETHARLEPAGLIPEGRTEPLRMRDKRGRSFRWDAAWLEQVVRLTPANERAIRIDGEWDTRAPGSYFGAVWVPSGMVLDELPAVEVVAQVGVDHGHRPGKQYACLVLVHEPVHPDTYEEGAPVYYVVDEYVDELGVADPAVDAAGILRMLERNDWAWHELAFVAGDRDHLPGREQRKSNTELTAEIREALNLATALEPPIRTVKRGSGRNWGSVERGCRHLYRAMAQGRFYVHRRCVRMRRTLERFRLRRTDDEWKDVIDALRYAIENRVFDEPDRAPGVALRIG